MGNLYLMGDDSDPLTLPELRIRGNQLLSSAKAAAAEALLASFQKDFLMPGTSYRLLHVRAMRKRAKEAADAWAKVDALLSELLNEVEKSARPVRSNR